MQKTDLKPDFRTFSTIFNEVSQLAMCHGCELVTWSTATKMKNAIETNGSFCTGNLEDIIQSHPNIFTKAADAVHTSQAIESSINFSM